MKCPRLAFASCALVLMTTTATGQSFNVDVGQPGSQPSANYAAAGRAGVWNSLRADHITPFTTGPTAQDVQLVDVNGNLTNVGFHQFGGMDLVSTNDVSVSGADAALLNDYLATHNTSLEDCMYLNGLEDGMYEVITYAWMPNFPGVQQKVRFDFHPGNDFAGGAWPGGHVEGVTYSREIVTVTNGLLGWHVGIPSGGATNPGAAFNGFQIRKIEATVPTLPEYGMIALAFGLLLVGGYTLQRRAGSTGRAG